MNKCYYIYETTNDIDGMKYIGQHLGTPDDSYIGSGVHFSRAVELYGKSHFHKEVLWICKDAEDANEQEKAFIAAVDAVNNPMYYNIAEGGNSIPVHQWFGEDNPFYGKTHSEQAKQKISKATTERLSNPENHWNYGNHWSEEHKQQLREKLGTKIRCYNNDEEHSFNSIIEAVHWLGLTSRGFSTSIKNAIKNKKMYRNYYWEYKE